MFFRFSLFPPLGKRFGPLFVKTWIPRHRRMLCAKFGWNWPSGSGEEDFLNFVNVSLPFHNYLPLEKGVALHLNKLEYPSPKDALCQVWLKLALWFLRRRFFNFVNVFSLFRNYLPLGKGMVLHLNKLESSPLKDALCQVWLKSAQQFWRRRWKCEKFTDRQTARQTDRQTDDRQKVIRKAHLSFQHKWAQKNEIAQNCKIAGQYQTISTLRSGLFISPWFLYIKGGIL